MGEENSVVIILDGEMIEGFSVGSICGRDDEIKDGGCILWFISK